jgi:glutathione peroxidase
VRSYKGWPGSAAARGFATWHAVSGLGANPDLQRLDRGACQRCGERSLIGACKESIAMTTAYDFTATDIDGRPASLADYSGKVLLIVNVASKCGFTPQYTGLEKLWQDYRERGLVVLGFPCDQFGHQEPGNEAEIKDFCSLTYDVDFPMFAKVDVNGDNAHPLWKWLKDEKGGFLGIDAIKWNFSKFLVGRDGRVLKRYAPADKPESLAADIEAALG